MSECQRMPPILHYRTEPAGHDLPRAAVALPGDPLADGREVHFHDPLQGYAVGRSHSPGADLWVEACAWVELSIVEAGELHLLGDGFDMRLGAGDCFIVPRGAKVHWRHRGPLRRVFMAFTELPAGAGMPATPVKLDLARPLPACDPPASDVLLTATPKAWGETLFSTAHLRVGLWQCEAYARKQVEPGYSELMFILQGAVTLTPEHGGHYHVRAGETVVVPKGATNAWASEETVRKVFCIVG